ncbi:hypothetical protein R3P38DRAFT_3378642 [Favolaschia claudopus]|uniref:Uncharacterized protein n=1 Tax=Favolaschia claudopus TaxID=2862362 RepID=A0AAV9Z838_9AGAR
MSHHSLSLIKRIVGEPLDQPLYSSTSEYCDARNISIWSTFPASIFAQLGTVNIEHYPDYLATGDGFNVVVEAFGGQDRPHHVLEVKAASDILRFLFFEETNPADNPWGDNHEMIELISRFVIHYLLEPGHPHHPDQVIGALIDADSTAARALERYSFDTHGFGDQLPSEHRMNANLHAPLSPYFAI